MTALTSAIVSHDLDAIERVVAADRSTLEVAENGWTPIQWAEKTGNLFTLVRLLRVWGTGAPRFDAKALLREYIEVLAYDEYEDCEDWQAARMVWERIYEGKEHKLGRLKRDIIPGGAGQVADLKFLIEASGDASKEVFAGAMRGSARRRSPT